MGRLLNKVCVITGAAQGIGKGVAEKLAVEGADVILADINEEEGKKTEQKIIDEGGKAAFFKVDVSNKQNIKDLFTFVSKEYETLDVLHTNTWWAPKQNVLNTSLEDWNKTMDITLTAPFLLSKYAIPFMQKSGGGSIIHTASVGGIVAFRDDVAYIVAKAGVIQLCKSIAVDFGKDKIRCNAICPGIIETPQTKSNIDDEQKVKYLYSKCLTGELGKPEDIANASVYLASDESKFVTGAEFKIDNGWTVI
ncbi:SDR family NAD(P)-dependent oxidoreductase [Pseudogracilibacillus auburnensis]|uniref:NAD(P)-dependent dehydrogenase (Short-subunit alcohol dehydrogenase family) n=1 Tax=Pseudogracilibacillus auburnensis TaxID=1494959 RepID=A0A2V3WB67_9BACI|nr:SDR family oxidoreductase [Pseudogracilibacillus auburnensis]PXW90394.1 NAD(P)-dependent dehydrogenase (short-subunit alcohol dehydrogenase family) [Pseudogracilibacillus auburnensis]